MTVREVSTEVGQIIEIYGRYTVGASLNIEDESREKTYGLRLTDEL